MRSFCVVAMLAAGCVGASDGPKDVSDAPDTESDVESDADTDSDAPPDTDTDPPGGTGAVLEQGALVTCLDPGVRKRDAFVRVESKVPAPDMPYLAGGGLALGDYDGDGRVDLLAVGHDAVFRGRPTREGLAGDAVLRLSEPASHPTHGFFGGLAWDPDDDGDLDVLVTGFGVPTTLLVNQGDATFVDGTAAAGLVIPAGHLSSSAAASDIDGDGDLDLVVGGFGYIVEGGSLDEFEPGDPTMLFLNDGAGHFVDATSRLPSEVHDGFTFVPTWFDADGDGDDDLYLINDFGRVVMPNRLVLNDGGTFRVDAFGVGLDMQMFAMGVGHGDLDGDGQEDLLLSDWGRMVAMQRNGTLWFDITQSLGLEIAPPRHVAWGNTIADLDNDGDSDILTAFGFVDTTFARINPRGQPDLLLVQNDDGTFRDRSADLEVDDTAPHRGVATVDLDRDGWLDLVRMGVDGRVRIDFANCGTASWLRVELRQPAPNRFAVGATVRAFEGGRTWVRRVRAGGVAIGTGEPPEVHFGLGDRATVDLEVTWPDGAVDRFEDVPTSRPVRIVRP